MWCRRGVRAGRHRRSRRGGCSVWRRPPLQPPIPLQSPPSPLPLTPPPLSPTVVFGEGRRPRLAAGKAALWRCRRGGCFLGRGPPPRPPTPLPPPPPPLLLTSPPLSPTLSCGERRRPRLAAGTAALWHIRRAPASAVAALAFSVQGPRWSFPALRSHCGGLLHRQQQRCFIESTAEKQILQSAFFVHWSGTGVSGVLQSEFVNTRTDQTVVPSFNEKVY